MPARSSWWSMLFECSISLLDCCLGLPIIESVILKSVIIVPLSVSLVVCQFCFAHFGAPLLAAHVFVLITAYWLIDPIIMTKRPSLNLVTFPVLKSTLSNISIAIQLFLWLLQSCFDFSKALMGRVSQWRNCFFFPLFGSYFTWNISPMNTPSLSKYDSWREDLPDVTTLGFR